MIGSDQVADLDGRPLGKSGDRATAIKTYKDIVDRYPEGSYPARIKQRIEAGGGG